LLDAYHEHRRQAIHYTSLARALGVANSTAYEMLRLLEQKGYVSSEYRLADDHVGPGRSMVLFRPTLRALRTFRRVLGEDARDKEWEFVKQKVLSQLATSSHSDDEALLDELVAAIPDSQDRLSYCGRVVAASLLSIKSQFVGRVQGLGVFKDIGAGDVQDLDTLNLLPGFALGLACALGPNRSWLSRLAEYVGRYQTYLHQLDEGARLRLLRFSRELLEAL
jgi:DNA-binding MarR family transcriptional regulator